MVNGKREERKCKECGKTFYPLSIKVRQGKGIFCSKECYIKHRKSNAADSKILNKLYQKKFRYNLSAEQYYQLIIDSNHRCAICNTEFDETKRNGINVDHSHETGKVRGLLCHNCNALLGHCHDNIDILKNAIEYLKKNC
jgi:hypothetical protein